MFDSSSIIVGLEIGTMKVCAVVGEFNADGALNIVGLGQARSRGIRKGEIVNAPTVEEDVRQAIVEAEQMADVEIRSVYLGDWRNTLRVQQPWCIRSFRDREISNDDLQDVVRNANDQLSLKTAWCTPSASISGGRTG
jgi:cell division protein FtsA